MNIHVYDTLVQTFTGQTIHFDVLVDDENINQVKQYAENYLTSLGIQISNIEQSQCNFCHSENANPEVQESILSNGHCIIRL